MEDFKKFGEPDYDKYELWTSTELKEDINKKALDELNKKLDLIIHFIKGI